MRQVIDGFTGEGSCQHVTAKWEKFHLDGTLQYCAKCLWEPFTVHGHYIALAFPLRGEQRVASYIEYFNTIYEHKLWRRKSTFLYSYYFSDFYHAIIKPINHLTCSITKTTAINRSLRVSLYLWASERLRNWRLYCQRFYAFKAKLKKNANLLWDSLRKLYRRKSPTFSNHVGWIGYQPRTHKELIWKIT